MTPAVTGATSLVGVIGDPIRHSLSPVLHNAAFAAMGLDWVSVAFEVPESGGEAAITGAGALGIRGLSVTMPHKATAARCAGTLTPAAARLGAVNCLDFSSGGLVGDNTDGQGFLDDLEAALGWRPEGSHCAVVGAGGAARAVVAALGAAGAAEVVVVNRDAGRAAAAAALAPGTGRAGAAGDVRGAALVVNATPLGMAGREGMPIDPALVDPGALAVDLVYVPGETAWLAALTERGVATRNGLGMLVHQAALALARWTGEEVPVAQMWAALSPAEGRR